MSGILDKHKQKQKYEFLPIPFQMKCNIKTTNNSTHAHTLKEMSTIENNSLIGVMSGEVKINKYFESDDKNNDIDSIRYCFM